MSQQGERPTGHEDDWWGQLYDDSTGDTGPAVAADSLDDRFASAAGTVGEGSGERGTGAPLPPTTAPVVPEQRPTGPEPGAFAPGADATWPAGSPPMRRDERGSGAPARGPAPWDPPSTRPTGPVTFPSGPRPPGFPPPPPDAVAPAEPTAVPGFRPPTDGPARPTETPPLVPPFEAAASAGAHPAPPSPAVDYVGSGPPTYDAEPTALPLADPDDLGDLVADTVLDGARYGACALRAVSARGDSARFRGEPRRDALLTARFGTGDQALVLVAMATGARAAPGAHRAAIEVCHLIGSAVGRSYLRLGEDIRAARRGELKSGLQRLTDRSLGRLRAGAAELGVDPDDYTATLRCLLLPADPDCRTRVFFGVGAGGLFRLRDGECQDIEPRAAEAAGEAVVGFGSLPSETPEGDRLTMDLGITTPPSPYEPAPEPPRDPFRFRASIARPGDILLLCTGGLADPLRGEPQLAELLTERWSTGEPPGLAAFLADTLIRVKGYADDRTAAAVWEA
ncbi:protein phosphatase 2C domain-containing protein [Streptomyces sp. NPDC004074]|uniref:protein phosphatase 2C domain-containing protein n=1 Tax=Streptomyces sp. NPDC004074 TaxID=3154277 RepID=UPI0033AB3774